MFHNYWQTIYDKSTLLYLSRYYMCIYKSSDMINHFFLSGTVNMHSRKLSC